MDKVEKELLALGIPASNKGFEALASAVRLYQAGNRVFTNAGGIYAKAVPDEKWTRTERNIRACIMEAYNRVPDMDDRLGCPCNCSRGSLTARDFIAAVAIRTR